MDPKTLIQLLNYSRTLIQDGEIQFLVYKKYPTHPDDVGAAHLKVVANWERQLRENPPKSKNPEALRKEILGYLEEEKKYGAFRGSKELFSSMEANLVFQEYPQSAYRLQIISRFENYPSLGSTRFFNGGGQFYFISNGTKAFMWNPPGQFANDRRVSYFAERADKDHLEVDQVKNLPPSIAIDETQAEVDISENNTGVLVYVITYLPLETTKAKVYVRLNAGLPEVFREEVYFKSDSPQADAEGYWLARVKLYSDFERVEALNITVPKVREDHQFRRVDGFMRYRNIMKIKEMDFNLGLPDNFFDWDETEITNESGKRKRIRGKESEQEIIE